MRRYAPSIGIGLGLSLRTSIAAFANYFKVGRVIDLFTNFFSSDTSIADQSGEGNDAIPYTGRYVYTDGSNDKAINANCSALGASTYKLTGKIRSTSTGAKVATIGGQAISYTVLAANVWEDFETSVTTSVTPSAVIVGWDGTSTFTGADWSEVRLIDTARSETVIPRWQLNDHSDDTTDGLNAKPCIDSSGNGYNGSHVGCTGATGEGIDPDVAGIVGYDDAQWFNGVGTVINVSPSISLGTGLWNISAKVFITSGDINICSDSGGNKFAAVIKYNGGNNQLQVRDIDGLFYTKNTSQSKITYGTLMTVEFLRESSTRIVARVNGVAYTAQITIPTSFSCDLAKIATRLPGQFLKGYFKSFTLTDDSGTLLSWDGTQADAIAQGWTVGGTSLTVGQKRETILQTAGMDWNKNTADYATTVLVPVSDADPTIDALGDAIAIPRPNNKVLNLFEEGEFVELPDVASLEDVRSITLAVYNDGTTKDILQAAAGASFVDIAANVLQTDQSGTHAYYVGGVATTTLAAGWNIVGITFDAAKDLSGGKIVATSGNLLAYDPNALTLADQLQNSTAFSPSYGL